LLTQTNAASANASIRRMTAEDIPAVARLEQECFAEPWSENALAESLADANYVFFVAAFLDETVAGYVGAYLAADELSITNVAVTASYRRCGAANQLMKALDAFAKEKNLYGITLEVRVSNSAAIALYEKNGYEKSGIRKGFYSKPKEDALIMWKYFQQ
jgi:[ribosomal protein S18]-alanine N-acetyltransferase